MNNPEYPIYIISKGRWEKRLTVKTLEFMHIPYKIVIEPQEYEEYARVINNDNILILPFSNLGQGSIPARNWVWEHSISLGYKKHWILDDNIRYFFRLYNNKKIISETGAVFKAAEDFVNRYTNVMEAGFNYFMFANALTKMPPYYLNTRIYSCILLDNSLKLRWRGIYNEDTDLSIRILKEGYCTILFNAFLAGKETTMHNSGGNTSLLYKNDGRYLMAQSLQEQHPDITKIKYKFNRWQHDVDYKVFSKNKLIFKEGIKLKNIPNNYGMKLIYKTDSQIKNELNIIRD